MNFTATDVIAKAVELGMHEINTRCEWTSPEGDTCAAGPYGSEGDAGHKIGGRRLCGFHSPYDTNAETLARYGYEEGVVIMEPVVEPLEIKFVKVGKGAAVHAALKMGGKVLAVTLCKRLWGSNHTHTGEGFGVTCKPCLKVWETLSKAAALEAGTLKTPVETESPAVLAPKTPLNTPQTTVEPVIDPDVLTADETAVLRLLQLGGEYRWSGRTYHVSHLLTTDTLVSLRALGLTEQFKLGHWRLTAEGVNLVLPRPVPTPATLDAQNLDRHIGEWVRVRNHGLAVLRRVIPARPGGRPGVVVDFPGWGDCECSLAEVMLSQANKFVGC